jgi:DNA-binding winged helix-turn-helix (wHTH) protein/TolB-like protein/Tfp pilus assembly protein PilF
MLLETRKFQFDDFLLDAKENVLLRGGKPVSITPKAFQLLLVLIENHGRLVEKDKLLSAVWADSFVEEGNLTFTIGLLRKVLDDNAQKPRFIETVPKRGYRFIGKLKENEQTQSDIISEQPLEETIKPQQPLQNAGNKAAAEETKAVVSPDRNKIIAALGIIFLLIGAIGLSYYLFSGNAAAGGKKSIAVLPLKPINTTNRDELYEVGIADSLIHRFSSMKGFVVRPLSATRKYADIQQDPLAAGREQQVDYVLAANYQIAGGKIRVTAQLFNVANGQVEDTYKSEKEAGNIFAMQDAVANEIGNKLLARFATVSNSPATKRGTTNEEAYRLYLQAMYLYEKRNLSDARKAVELLEQAVRLDPNYAPAWAGLAHAHRTVANQGRNPNIQEEYQKSMQAINKALALDENLAHAYSALCENKMYYEYDFAGAERECRRAIELDPNSALAHQIYARYLNTRARGDEAIAEAKIAVELEPASLYHQRVLGTCFYFARRYDEAAEQFRRVAAMDENYSSTYTFMIPTLEMQGKEQEAFEWLMKLLAIQKANEKTVRNFQTAFDTSGWQGVLRERLTRFNENEPDKSDEAYFQGAAYYARLGNKDKAFEFLEKSFERRELWIANLLVDPRIDSLRDDPRFDGLLKRVESK